MFINEFWCGAIATVLLEIVILIGGGIYIMKKDKKKGK